MIGTGRNVDEHLPHCTNLLPGNKQCSKKMLKKSCCKYTAKILYVLDTMSNCPNITFIHKIAFSVFKYIIIMKNVYRGCFCTSPGTPQH